MGKVFKVAIITVSDKGYKGEREDRSGKYLIDFFKQKQWDISDYIIVPDEKDLIKEKLKEICDGGKANLILTTGGTGFSARDITPEATKEVIEREAPGFSEIIRIEGQKKTPRSILSRGVSGIRKNTLIINLPGSIKGVKDSLELIYKPLPHGLDILLGRDAECGSE
ncbi:MAG: MogA/MoaB family molybdenum cofactor biosynthesis protein [Actinobacteria bacterium]|nr:MogA/MoaB family molybdenum cofactor biosynthesis protein [Cyanobacteriota bacterium]MCL5772397.1 MogA/MoaB family molybdenum cofactor biosynthesis protein [Actinomycetota bacterium]